MNGLSGVDAVGAAVPDIGPPLEARDAVPFPPISQASGRKKKEVRRKTVNWSDHDPETSLSACF